MNLNNLPIAGGNIGIEREMIRSNPDATLANTSHPQSLGNVFTHPNITIDYAEALLELVTDTHQNPQAVYEQLTNLHRYTAQHLDKQLLWPTSMPCILPDNEDDIAIGYFGTSNTGTIKRLYRKGLSHRYGKAMQMIAGIHFNYSPPDDFWPEFAKQQSKTLNQDFINNTFLSQIRNLQRYSWLICHLFGASPAVDRSFKPAQNVLANFTPQTLGWKNANSLRMSKLGYQNKVDFTVSFNNLHDYLRDLINAVKTPAPEFEYLGLKDKNGRYQQISTHILQIANEYYTAARPKQPVKTDELPLKALYERGIRYVELRVLDINPFDPCGISLEQIHFLEAFMLWSLITPAETFTTQDYNESNHNRQGSACCGRRQDFPLSNHGKTRLSGEWANEILSEIAKIAAQLDEQNATHSYSNAIAKLQRINQANNQEGLAARCYQEISSQGFIAWAQALQEQHYGFLHQSLADDVREKLEAQSKQSLIDFAAIEKRAKNQIPFADYLTHYFEPLDNIHL